MKYIDRVFKENKRKFICSMVLYEPLIVAFSKSSTRSKLHIITSHFETPCLGETNHLTKAITKES